MTRCDFLVIGAGVVGVSIARALTRAYPDASVHVVDKEDRAGLHASGRNSGVLHAGFYYSADSLKARFTRAGNLAWRQFCAEQDLPLRDCGKLVVARDAGDLAGLDELARRGALNGIPLETIAADEARRIEPRAATYERALWSPSTATVDPLQVLHALCTAAERAGVRFHYGARYLYRRGETIVTAGGDFAAGHVVNAAGLQADAVAHEWGFGRRYRVLPFRGLYLYGDDTAGPLRTHIYPVPDLRHPFLGVHFTVTIDGRVKIGPTAIPALWREQYDGFDRFDAGELLAIGWRQLRLALTPHVHYLDLAAAELPKLSRRYLVAQAARLVNGVDERQFTRWGRPGVRAQLVDVAAEKLVLDFIVEGDAHSTHVLNAVSPGFTCAPPFADWVVTRLDAALSGASWATTAQ